MLVLRLRGQDVAAVRFAISPLNEVVASLIRRRRRGLNPATSPWEGRVDALLATEDTTLLDVLVSPRGWVPDVLTPFPNAPRPVSTTSSTPYAAPTRHPCPTTSPPRTPPARCRSSCVGACDAPPGCWRTSS